MNAYLFLGAYKLYKSSRVNSNQKKKYANGQGPGYGWLFYFWTQKLWTVLIRTALICTIRPFMLRTFTSKPL